MPDEPHPSHPAPSDAPPVRDRGRPWRALLFSLAGFGALIAAIYAFVAAPLDSWGEKVVVGQMTVHYPGEVPVEMAEKVAHFLHDRGVGRLHEADARLRRRGDGWLVDLFMPQNPNTDTDDTTAMLERMHRDLSRDVFGGAPLVLRACDPSVGTNRFEQRGEPKAWKEVGP
jgi:hypothetical protein